MTKAGYLNVGDTAIYINNSEIKTSKVVKEPVDDGVERPKFKIGRTDLENGDYLVNGCTVYDTEEEAKQVLIRKLEKEVEEYEEKKLFYEGLTIIAKNKLKRLKEEE